jgi:Xaa-Pro dipeptidase
LLQTDEENPMNEAAIVADAKRGAMSMQKDLAFTEAEFRARVDRVVQAMAGKEWDALVVTVPENINYLSGFDTPGYYYPEYLLIHPRHLPRIAVRQFEARNVDAYCWFSTDRRLVFQDYERPVEALGRLLAEEGLSKARIGIELGSWFLTVRDHAAIVALLPEARFVDATGIVEHERAVKSPAEVAYIRAACRLSEHGLKAAVEACERAPITEAEVAAEIYKAMYSRGGEYSGLPVFFASGHRSMIPHGRWSTKMIERGESAICELTGVVRRYAGPIFRTIAIGKPSQDIVTKSQILEEMLQALIDIIAPGVTSHEVNDAVVKVGKRLGGGITKRAGYSVGINYPPDWGEGIFLDLKNGDQTVLRPGMTFHMPQSFRAGNAPTVAMSETVLVTETGCEVLTNYPRHLIVV